MGYFRRRTEFRQTRKLYIIASEGARTEPLYLNQFKPPRDAVIDIKVIRNPRHKSKPKDVLDRLKKFANQEKIKSSDELWLIIDRDAWEEVDLDDVCNECQKLNYFVALSNPCFELWLYLHLADNKAFNDRHDCQRHLCKICPGYEKGQYDAAKLVENVFTAIARAKAIDTAPHQPWPKSQCTRVYHLIEKLIE